MSESAAALHNASQPRLCYVIHENQAICHHLNLGVGVGTVMAAVREKRFVFRGCAWQPSMMTECFSRLSFTLCSRNTTPGLEYILEKHHATFFVFLVLISSLCMARSAVKLTPGPLSSRVSSKRKSMDACDKLLESNSCYCFHNPPRIEALYNKSRWSERHTLKAIFTGRWSVCSVVCCVLGEALISCF